MLRHDDSSVKPKTMGIAFQTALEDYIASLRREFLTTEVFAEGNKNCSICFLIMWQHSPILVHSGERNPF